MNEVMETKDDQVSHGENKHTLSVGSVTLAFIIDAMDLAEHRAHSRLVIVANENKGNPFAPAVRNADALLTAVRAARHELLTEIQRISPGDY